MSVTSQVIFRTATIEDVPVVLALLADDAVSGAAQGEYGEAHRAAFEAIEADPHNELIVAELDGEVVGTMQLTYIPGISRGGALRLQIEAVRIAAHLRGRGLGGQMMRWAVERGRTRGCALVQLTTNKVRGDAHRFYDSLGFVASHEGYKLALN
ncbi:GNAT family N-acetyltransferase [Streptosporangium saharense]|uniref:GNAT superfamily N-acetyltransferase n=1 Tax=Streptosporangium saharense TaxID=1706840 RepID=A0A7W7VS17_9ACTN|nr:GNAT family N-acetyltransferase [Streptosporangium saharense]MBB4920682.1 GNAT superfamily N-acetyltransferase [Streptosporangium saharense]